MIDCSKCQLNEECPGTISPIKTVPSVDTSLMERKAEDDWVEHMKDEHGDGDLKNVKGVSEQDRAKWMLKHQMEQIKESPSYPDLRNEFKIIISRHTDLCFEEINNKIKELGPVKAFQEVVCEKHQK